MKIHRNNGLVLLVILIITGLLIYTKRKPREYFHYKGEIFADQAGYYMYLPAVFIYDFNGENLTPNLVSKVGFGFSVDSTTGKMITKYSIGVALLQSPFFLAVHSYNLLTGKPTDGFSGNYHNIPNWAAWVYSSFALWMFFLFLVKRVRRSVALLMLMVVYFGTSVYYYGADNTGMSHIYSFFLFSAFIYFFDKVCREAFKYRDSIILGLIGGLIVVVRPVNLMFVGMAVPYLIMLNGKSKDWVKSQVNVGKVLLGLISGILMILPQLMYWKYTSGSWIFYSYGNEGFTNWKNPEIIPFFFSPKAGLFSYSPAYLGAILIMAMGLKKPSNRWLTFGFATFCFLMASWHTYFFGCSFGSRNLLEFSVIFFVPLVIWVEANWKKWIGIALILCCVFSINLMISFSGCYYEDKWDWAEYENMLKRGAYHTQLTNVIIPPSETYGGLHSNAHRYFTATPFREADVYLKAQGITESTQLVFEVYRDSIVQFSSVNVLEEMQKDREEGECYYSFLIDRNIPQGATIKSYLFNEGGDSIYVKKLSLWLH